ncbi:restriction endonuclease [Dactylosporangium aurantiacum]|uniref:Restriction endonuclease n=1 Tax=Dactylosporangium aurantiacum TaxID=35754 RepID=A0A9Q9ILE0_9ACTN|nr:restriction endonuclease [Dactylosporangium aurantiacum]MDG6100926.1 restriction endonuclease [Dactylosporangium aurantiacum]UWZ55020.1 restriction endonuclease [Dactylosporangium aurantiacum]
MARRHSGGALSLLVEAHRRNQRQQLAQLRAWEAAQRQHEKAQRAAQRAAAGANKAAMAAYQSARETEAARHTADLERRVGVLQTILAAGAAAPPVQLANLRVAPPTVPFTPGPLATPIRMPDSARYQVPPLPALQALNPAARRRHDEDAARARSRFEHDWHLAQAAETERVRRLEELRQQHFAWVQEQTQRAATHNAHIDALAQRMQAGHPDAIAEYFAGVLYAGQGWPAQFPRHVTAAWDADARQLVVDWQLPPFTVIPEVTRIRYVKSNDEYKEIAFPAGQRASLYRDVLCQSSLRVIADAFRADVHGYLDSVAFNGYVSGSDPASGLDVDCCLVTVTIGRNDLHGMQLTRVNAVDCLTALRGQVSARPERLTAVRPGRRPESVAGVSDVSSDGDDIDLHAMDPVDFEELVAQLFRARGLDVKTTARSGDEGVDVLAEDPDPITGGLIVIQVKRYRATVSPNVVRELFGVVQHHGATKGILVTTSSFGPGSHEFARDKPLKLIAGQELVGLLAECGLPGRLGPA